MEIVNPENAHVPQLMELWQLAFGDGEDFVRGFFQNGFDPRRCRCLVAEGKVRAGLYWFPCACRGRRLAYLYAVATHPDCRRRGLCRLLMEDARQQLGLLGYAGILLMPAGETQRRMYAAMGYKTCTGVSETAWQAGKPLPLRKLRPEEYAALRREYLPQGGVIQEGAALAYLHTFASFYAGEDFLLAAAPRGEMLWGMELLGRQEAAPGILGALGYEKGIFRTPGEKIPFAMYLPLIPGAVPPDYFGLALD